MIPRIKLIAAALGLIVAAGTIGDASAHVVDQTIVKKTVVTHSIRAPRLHRVVLVPRRGVLHRFVAYGAPVVVRSHVVGPRIVLRRHVALHRTIVRKTIIR